MWNPLSPNPQFAICVENSEYPASLELHKLYRVVPDSVAPLGPSDEEISACSCIRFLNSAVIRMSQALSKIIFRRNFHTSSKKTSPFLLTSSRSV